MDFEFPIYPFIWDYSDMYNLINYNSKILENKNDYDENIIYLLEKFPNSKIIESTQIINSRITAKNLNIHTWYLVQNKLFESNENTVKIITNSKIKVKSNIKCFIFDPLDIFDNLMFESNKKIPNIAIIKKKTSIIPELIPELYIHTHNVKGIFRFSPNDIKQNINNGIFYIQMDKLIIKFNLIFL
jgi:hypothetical protein